MRCDATHLAPEETLADEATCVSASGRSPDDIPNAGNHRLECLTCPYQYILQARYYERKTFTHKEREDMFGGKGQWDNAQRASVQCTKEGCDGDVAAYYQVQIRSADEPMTSFYK
ncbi:DNA-directed RNA polymerase III subunit RPC10, partial [Lachnellula cervina]